MEAQWRRKNFSLKNAFWSNKPKTKSFFTKNSLKKTVQFLIESLYFAVGNGLLIQTVSIPIRIDRATFWVNLYLYNFESKYIADLIRKNELRGKSLP